MPHTASKPLEWTGSSRRDLKAFPEPAQGRIGYALYQAQQGFKHRSAKPLSGVGSGILEVVSDFASDTYRAVYTIRFREAVYVLHVFQKKSKKGIATPQAEIDLIRSRAQLAARHYRQTYGRES